MRLGHKLTLAFVIIVLLVALVGHLCVRATHQRLVDAIGQRSTVLAANILDDIDRTLYRRLEQLTAFSKHLARDEELLKSNQDFGRLADVQEYMDARDTAWRAAAHDVITPLMSSLIGGTLSQTLREELEVREFYEERYGQMVFSELFVTNQYGANVAQTGRTSDYYQADEEWWQRAKKDGVYIADIAFDASANVYSTDIGIRIDDEEGRLVAVMKAVVNIAEVVTIVREAEASADYKTAAFTLLTKDGRAIVSSKQDEFLEHVSGKLYSQVAEEGGAHNDYVIAESDSLGEGDAVIAHAHSRGWRDYQGLGWILVVEYGADEALGPIGQLEDDILIATAVVLALAIAAGAQISRTISRRLTELGGAAAKIGRGELNTRIETKSNDEIAMLARSLNAMAANLREVTASRDELNGEIAEREQAEATMRDAKETAEAGRQELRAINIDLENAVAAAERAKADMQRMNAVMMGREQRVLEIKQEVNDLLAELGQTRRYEHV